MINFGSEQTVTIGEKPYRLGKLRLRHIRAFRDWVAAQIGDPFAAIERFVDKLPGEQALALIKEAEQTKRDLESFRLLCPLGQRFLFTEEGLRMITGMLLEQHHPDASEDEIEEVVEVLASRMVEALTTAMGSVPNEEGPGAQDRPAASTGTQFTSASGITGQP